ncbi:MAG: tRNA pseudouridine(55) synthase TruB [Thermomicrobiales bacterium]
MPRSRDSDLHGFVVVDKAAGWSSHDAVARVRKLIGVRRVGHAGTLDPFATGVLVLGVGKATRLLQYIQGSTKVYQATIRLGEETDTLDPEGVIVSRKDVSAWPSADQVARVIERFIGTIQQVPPAHSAIHIEGKRAYDLARAGQEFDLPTRTVTIDGITIRGYDPPRLDLEIVCHTGTYIRSLARDIGRELQT